MHMSQWLLRLISRFRVIVVGVIFTLLYGVMLFYALRLALHFSPPAGTPPATGAAAASAPEPWKQFSTLAPIFVALVTAVASAVLSFFTLATQLEAQRSIEWLKKSIPSFGDLYAAASSYYRALAPMETGNLNMATTEDAETAMKSAEGTSLFVPDDYASAWRAFWQTARALKENATAKSSQEQKTLWAASVKPLGRQLNDLREIARTHLKD
jgi:hypothetical protein